jgi:molecular chaperone GrpE
MSEVRKIKVNVNEEENSDPAALEEDAQFEAESPSAKPAAGDGAEGTAQELPAALAERLAAKEKECSETYERLLRTTAEFDNFKKRAARELDEFRKYANQSLLREMLSAVDHIELAIESAKAASEPDTGLLDGLNLTLKELLRIFEKFNVTPIAALGEPFNPEFHEAIMRQESAEVPENSVLREMQKGYMIGARLLRPAMVVVAAAPKTAGEPAG